MACEFTFRGNAADLIEFISGHYPDDAVAWTAEPTDSGQIIVRSTSGANFVVRPGQRVRWAPNSIPGGRFEVRGGFTIG